MTQGGRYLKIASTAVLALLVILTASAALERPLVSYAKSGSMEPTLRTFDGFIINPFPAEVTPGDVIVYRSLTRGGEPAVHRVVGGDPVGGWYTKGDANIKEDQFQGEPRVTQDRILGKVVTDGEGNPVVIPNLGVPVTAMRIEVAKAEKAVGGPATLKSLVFGLVAFVILLPAFDGGRRRPFSRPHRPSRFTQRILRKWFPRGILGRHLALGLVVVLMATSAWAAATSKTEISMEFVVVEESYAADGVRAGAPGDVFTRTIFLSKLALIPAVAVVEPGTENVRVPTPTVRVGVFEQGSVDVEAVAGPQPGLQQDTVRVWLYPGFLPESAILALHEWHPGGPYLLMGAILSVGGYVWYLSLNMANVPVGRWLGFKEDWI